MAQRYDALVARQDKNGKTWWTKIGSMFPAKEGDGFSLSLDALPLTGADGQARIILKVPKPKDDGASRGNDMNGDNVPF